MTKVATKIRVFAGLVCLVIIAGCGEVKFGEVTGRVTFKGKPLPHAVVFFVPERGPASAGATRADGTFTMLTKRPGDGVLLGPCKVAITPADPILTPLPIPVIYTDAETSGLTAHVEEGANNFDFEIPD